jgi:hypothetical protein
LLLGIAVAYAVCYITAAIGVMNQAAWRTTK